jgi:hypothetical protein
MQKRARFGVLAGFAMAALVSFLVDSSAQDKAKHSIKDVMKKAHKEGLLKTVASGKATKEDKDTLIELYTALGQNKPPKGEAGSWKEKTDAILSAAKDAAKDAKAGAKLQKTVDCKGCHSAHKG